MNCAGKMIVVFLSTEISAIVCRGAELKRHGMVRDDIGIADDESFFAFQQRPERCANRGSRL